MTMPLSGYGRIMQVEDHRTLIYVSQRVATDSAWPFVAGERVALRVEPGQKRLLVEKLPANPVRALHAVLMVAILLFAGCAKPPQVVPSEGEGPQSTILVDVGGGKTIAVPVGTTTGSLAGTVTDDAGFGLQGAHVSLLKTDNATQTNATGWFQFTSLPPRDYDLRVDRSGFRAAEATVAVSAGNVTRLNVTMVPMADVGAGYRPHVHDYWAGRDVVQVIDTDVEFDRAHNANPAYEAYNTYGRKALQAASSGCTRQQGQQIHSSAYRIYFDDPGQTVWAGTRWINGTITWGNTDFVGTDVAVVWRAPGVSNYSQTGTLKNGAPYSIKVDSGQWDAGHQVFSLWEFYLCTNPTNAGFPLDAGQVVAGKFHVAMSMVRGSLITPEAPHRHFWANGSVENVINATKLVGNGYLLRDPQSGDVYGFRPKTPALVPPGTSLIRARLEWMQSGNWPSQVPLTMSYSPANVNPRDRWNLANYVVPPSTTKGPNFVEYAVKVKPAESDAFYQASSNWLFVWNYEGHERDDSWIPCVCSHEVHLRVDAIYEKGGEPS